MHLDLTQVKGAGLVFCFIIVVMKKKTPTYSKYQQDPDLYNNLCAYISVCNDVMEANQTRFPFTQIWHALEVEIAGRPIEYSVSHGKETAKLTATITDLKINVIPSPDNNRWPTITQKVDWPYMASVLKSPQRFIANPVLLNWNFQINNKIVQLNTYCKSPHGNS